MRSFVAATLCAALLAGVSDASAQGVSTGGQLSSYKVGVWNAGAYSVAGSPAFAFCAGTATYNSGITVSFLLTKAGTWGIALFDPAWNLTVGTNYSIVMAVDSSASGLDTASAITTNEVLITLKPTVALFKTFMEGQKLRVEVASGTYTFDLTNTVEMLPSLVKCVETNSGPIPVSSNPFAG